MKRTRPLHVRPVLAATALACAALLLPACGSTPPSRVYDLTPVAGGEETPAGGPRVLLSYIEIPGYLDGSKIVTRVGGNELIVAEYERWGEPLDENFARVLSKNLSLLIPSDQIFRNMWELGRDSGDYELTAVVQRFDVEDGRAALDVRWVLTRAADGERLALELKTYEHAVSGDGYAAIASALSETVGAFSRDAAAAIRAAEAVQ